MPYILYSKQVNIRILFIYLTGRQTPLLLLVWPDLYIKVIQNFEIVSKFISRFIITSYDEVNTEYAYIVRGEDDQPETFHAPSIWQAAVATPNMKFFGKHTWSASLDTLEEKLSVTKLDNGMWV